MNRKFFQEKGRKGGKKGGKAKGANKCRSTEHYRMMAKKSAEARRLKRDNTQAKDGSERVVKEKSQ